MTIDDREHVECSECGALISPCAAPAHAQRFDRVLCFDCAARRGAEYDRTRKPELAFPEADTLLDTRRPRNGLARSR
jgi:hypothetical protein